MMEFDLLQSLKPGDVVAFYSDSYYRFPIKVKVERVTASQIVLGNGVRLNRKSGRKIGGGAWDLSSIHPWTEELEKELRLHNLKRRIINIINHLENKQRHIALKQAENCLKYLNLAMQEIEAPDAEKTAED